jgi:hypothetical protein
MGEQAELAQQPGGDVDARAAVWTGAVRVD